MSTRAPEKIRDAERSREAILASAERFFADHGYEGTSLNDIAAKAGLSRGTPSYFFGSKEQLYQEVIERTFEERDRATRAAFEPVHDWCEARSGLAELRHALMSAAADYMAFLARKPSFVKLIMREELAGGRSIHARKVRSTAMEDAFGALASVGSKRGLGKFEVDDAVLLFIALTFAPVSYSSTLMRAVKRDLRKPGPRKQQVELAISQLMRLFVG